MIPYLMTGAGLCRINLRSKDLVPIAVRDSHGIAVGHAHVRVTRFKAAQRWSIPAVCAVIAGGCVVVGGDDSSDERTPTAHVDRCR
jgi:hypothetical protein